MAFDIEEQAARAKEEDKGTEVHVHGPDEQPMYYEEDGEQKPVIIVVAGIHSSFFRRAEERLRKRKVKAKSLTSEFFHEETLDKASACTLSWRGFTSGAANVPCTPENAKLVYRKCPWVLDQVLEAMQDHSRFFESSSTEPSSTSELSLD